MYRPHWLIALGTLILLATVVATGGPILPRAELSPEVYSLANLNTVRLVIKNVVPDLEEAGITAEVIREKWVPALEKAGLTVSEKGDAPKLKLVTIQATHPDCPECVSVTVHLSLEQPMHISRTGVDAVIPTYALVHTMMAPRTKLGMALDSFLPEFINYFARRIKTASAERSGEE